MKKSKLMIVVAVFLVLACGDTSVSNQSQYMDVTPLNEPIHPDTLIVNYLQEFDYVISSWSVEDGDLYIQITTPISLIEYAFVTMVYTSGTKQLYIGELKSDKIMLPGWGDNVVQIYVTAKLIHVQS